MTYGLSCSMARGIFPDQGSNLCLLPWQVDSLPLSHQGSTGLSFIISPLISPELEGIVVTRLLRYPVCVLPVGSDAFCCFKSAVSLECLHTDTSEGAVIDTSDW